MAIGRNLTVSILSYFALQSAAWGADRVDVFAERPDLAPDRVQSGFAYLTSESQALQNDEFANPGNLWTDRGEALFAEPVGAASCASCHAATGPDSLAGAATRYPRVDVIAGGLVNLERKINHCRAERQGLAPWDSESEPLLAVSAYVASLSKGLPYRVSIDGAAAEHFARGRDYFFRRKGQLNLACNQCHDDNWGRRLRGDTLSQGHPNAFPSYRFEWQALGSLHRRLQDCDSGVRAQPHALGSLMYTSVELYLTWRAAHLPIEVPGIRR